MLAQVKKIAGGDIAGRLGAWWDGRDYIAPAPAEEGAAEQPPPAEQDDKQPRDAAKAPAAGEVKAEEAASAEDAAEEIAPASPAETSFARIKALETLWGEGRLSPGSDVIDGMILDAVLESADKLGAVGFIGSDAALLLAFAERSDRGVHVAEWRHGCDTRLRELAPKVLVEQCEIDRPRGFADDALEGIVSCEAFAFADHKVGLVSRVCRALGATGRWVFLDTTRNTAKTPPEAFASAWAEPLLSTAEDIEEMLKHAGFGAVKRTPVTTEVLAAAREGYARLAQVLEDAAVSGMPGREGALFLQELAWEAQSWRARMRALEGGALEVNLWIADKGAVPLELTQRAASLPEGVLDLAVPPDDAGAADALFDEDVPQ